VDDEREWLPARDDAEDSMDNEHEWLPFAEKRDNGVTTMRVARGEQGASGAEPTSGVDENPAAAATNNKVKKKRKKRTAKCVLCKHNVADRTVSNFFVGLSHDDVFGSVFDRFSRTKQKRIGTIDPNQQLCQGDGLCKTCASICEDCVLDWGEWTFGLTANDARKLQILSAHVRDTLNGKLPRTGDMATLARWDHENAEERDGVPIDWFWYSLTRSENKERRERLKKFNDASAKELEFLERCVFREDLRGCQTIATAEANDARKIKILSAHVRDTLSGKLPRERDVATLARWDHENAGEKDGVPIGKFWFLLTHSKNTERRARLKNFDGDSKNALEYLETCEPRKVERPGRKPHL
jgi:hypothetical protein